jgi:hypothetical protein
VILYTNRHKAGDYMIERKFALFPVEIDEQRKAWLQYVFVASKVQHGGAYTTIKYFLTKDEADKYIKHINDKLREKDKWSR